MSDDDVKTASLGHKAEAALVRAALGLFRALPPATASRLGGGVAKAIGPLIPVSKVADRNLQAAMPELDAASRKKIVAQVWENLGSTVAELAQIGNLHETASGPGYYVTGWDEHVAPALPKDGPTIFLTGHIGNWEIIPPATYGRGVDIAFIYRAASNSLVNDIILGLREANFQRKVTMFPKGGTGARQAYAHMMRGKNLGLLMDQKLDNGIAVPFFGRPAMTGTALASFALKFKCPVFPVRAVREGPARLHVIYEAPMTLPDSGDKERDVLAMTTDMNNILERWIRETPGAWLWLHRRWPKTPR
jgi:KDO2-lipid IV(A) lauroyltransferase